MRKIIIGTLIAVMLLSFVIGSASLPSTAFQPLQRVEANAGTQWNAAYYNNKDLSGAPALERVDDKIDFNWGEGSPDPAINTDGFSARWTKSVNFPTAGTWVFHVEADDSLRMWIDATQIVAKWNVGGFWTHEAKLDALTAGNHELKVEYKEESAGAQVKVWWEGPGGTTDTGTGGRQCAATWNAQYFDNGDVVGDPKITRVDSKIDFNWGAGSPDPGIGVETFSARWTTTINFTQSGHWRFYAGADDGINIWIDVTQILDEWHTTPDGYRTYEANVYELTPGNHDVKVEYFEETGDAGVQVCWEFIAVTATGAGGGGIGAGESAIAPIVVPPAVVYAAVVGDTVNVRTGPGRGNPVMTKIPYNEDYLVVAGVPDLSWLLIRLPDGREGWVSNAWVYLYATNPEKNIDTTDGGQPDFVDDIPRIDIEVAPPAFPPEDDPLRIVLTGSATDTVNLRDGPSVGASRIIGSIPQTATFRVEAHNGNGAWYLIEYQGIRGWVSALYVRLLDGYVRDLIVSSEIVAAPPFGQIFVPENDLGSPAVTVSGRAISNLKLRNEASILTGDQIGSVPQYSEFVIYGRTSIGSWYLITWDGQEGWVNAAYVTLLEGNVSDIPIR